TAIDVTERKRAEEALLKAEELLKQGVRVAGLGIFDHDLVAETLYWSPELRTICGWGPDEPAILSAFVDHVHPEDRAMVPAGIQRTHDPSGDGRYDIEHRFVCSDGTIRWLRVKAQTFFEGRKGARHAVRTVGVVLDITEQKMTEEYRERLLVHEKELR